MTFVEPGDSDRLEHEAFVYGDEAAYARTLAPVVSGAVAVGTQVIAVVPDARAELLGDALRATAAAVQWIDAASWYVHPVRTLAAYEATLRAVEPGTRTLVIGEVQFGDTAEEWAAWTRYESVLNRTLERYAARVICPYDRSTLPASVVDDARRSHPLLLDDVERRASDAYVEPEHLVGAFVLAEVRVPSFPPDVDLVLTVPLRDARAAFVAVASAAGFDAERVLELTLALNEVLTNAVVHGGGTCRLRVWSTPGVGVECLVEDDGAGVGDPLAGFRPPPAGAVGGYGLWIVRRLFDRVELVKGERGGMTVHLVAGI